MSDITDIIGKNDYTTAMDYSKIKTAMENVSICGEVTNVQRKTYTRKYTRNGETQEVEKAFYMTLYPQMGSGTGSFGFPIRTPFKSLKRLLQKFPVPISQTGTTAAPQQ